MKVRKEKVVTTRVSEEIYELLKKHSVKNQESIANIIRSAILTVLKERE